MNQYKTENETIKEEKNKIINEINNIKNASKSNEETINKLTKENSIQKLNSEIIGMKDLINKKDVEIKKLVEENNTIQPKTKF